MDLYKLQDDLAKIELYFVRCANNAAIGSEADRRFRGYVRSIGEALELVNEKMREQRGDTE